MSGIHRTIRPARAIFLALAVIGRGLFILVWTGKLNYCRQGNSQCIGLPHCTSGVYLVRTARPTTWRIGPYYRAMGRMMVNIYYYYCRPIRSFVGMNVNRYVNHCAPLTGESCRMLCGIAGNWTASEAIFTSLDISIRCDTIRYDREFALKNCQFRPNLAHKQKRTEVFS